MQSPDQSQSDSLVKLVAKVSALFVKKRDKDPLEVMSR